MTTDTIAIEDARAIVHGLDPGALARRVWRAASEEGGQGRDAAAVLDLADGTLLVITWRAGGVVPVPRRSIVLAWITSATRENTWRSLSATAHVAPSCEVVEEEVFRRGAGEDLCWSHVEEQLLRAYALEAVWSVR